MERQRPLAAGPAMRTPTPPRPARPPPPSSLPRPARDALDYLAVARHSPTPLDAAAVAGLASATEGGALAELCDAAVAVRDAGSRGSRLATFSPTVGGVVVVVCVRVWRGLRERER
jgi:hypothetical protein